MRPQIEQGQGGSIDVLFSQPPDVGSVRLTVLRASGGAVEGAPIAAAVVTDAYLLTLPVGASGLTGETAISVGALPAEAYPTKGARLQANSVAGYGKQTVQVRDIDVTAQAIYLRQPLALDLAAGDTLRGVRVFAQIAAEQCPRVEQNFRAVFSATASGARITAERIYDVGLRATYNPADLADIEALWPDLHACVPPEWQGTDLDSVLAQGFDAVCASLYSTGRNPNRIRDLEPVRPLIGNRCLRTMALHGLVPSAWVQDVRGWITQLDADYSDGLTVLFSGLQWYDDDDDGIASSAVETKPLRLQVSLER